MKKEVKIMIGIGVAVIAIFGIGAILQSNTPPINNNTTGNETIIMGKNPHSTAKSLLNYKVTLVEFGDFQCPACGFAHVIIKKILADHPNDINLIFRHFPLSQHKNAIASAEAAEAASAQGKFWEMHDMLYENQDEWAETDNTETYFQQYATKLQLNLDQFNQDRTKHTFLSQIEQDRNDGLTLQLGGTPTFFINNRQYTGNLSYGELAKTIEVEIAKGAKTSP